VNAPGAGGNVEGVSYNVMTGRSVDSQTRVMLSKDSDGRWNIFGWPNYSNSIALPRPAYRVSGQDVIVTRTTNPTSNVGTGMNVHYQWDSPFGNWTVATDLTNNNAEVTLPRPAYPRMVYFRYAADTTAGISPSPYNRGFHIVQPAWTHTDKTDPENPIAEEITGYWKVTPAPSTQPANTALSVSWDWLTQHVTAGRRGMYSLGYRWVNSTTPPAPPTSYTWLTGNTGRDTINTPAATANTRNLHLCFRIADTVSGETYYTPAVHAGAYPLPT
jgi:hypothetical protein